MSMIYWNCQALGLLQFYTRAIWLIFLDILKQSLLIHYTYYLNKYHTILGKFDNSMTLQLSSVWEMYK